MRVVLFVFILVCIFVIFSLPITIASTQVANKIREVRGKFRASLGSFFFLDCFVFIFVLLLLLFYCCFVVIVVVVILFYIYVFGLSLHVKLLFNAIQENETKNKRSERKRVERRLVEREREIKFKTQQSVAYHQEKKREREKTNKEKRSRK